MLTAETKVKTQSEGYMRVDQLAVGDVLENALSGFGVEIVDILARRVDFSGAAANSSLRPVTVYPKQMPGGGEKADAMLLSPEQQVFCALKNDVAGDHGRPGCRRVHELIEDGCAERAPAMRNVTYFVIVLKQSAFVEAGGLVLLLAGPSDLGAKYGKAAGREVASFSQRSAPIGVAGARLNMNEVVDFSAHRERLSTPGLSKMFSATGVASLGEQIK